PDRASLRLVSAGHPPPLLRAADGSVVRLDEGRSLPIGASADAVYVEAVVPLEPASLMVFYTDGLVERRGESIDTGIDRLASEIATSASAVADVADRIIDTLFDANHTDDVVLVAVMVGQLRAQGFSTQLRGGPRSLAPMRAELRAWLRSIGAADDEIFDILVAVNEACSNAIEHPIAGLGAAATDQRIVFVEGKVVRREVSIVVRNPGRWKPSGPSGDRGRGLEFMDVLMEGVEVIRSPHETAVHLRRRLRLEVDA
ncbi:MAG: SpoIIE family protein phosphatase, partial [Gaiellaceae bacterium]